MMNICNKISTFLVQSCDALVNSDDTLTQDGMHARSCIENGALLAGGAILLGVPPTAVISALPLASKLGGCDDAINTDLLSVGQLKNLGGIFR